MGLFANALTIAAGQMRSDPGRSDRRQNGLAGWILQRVRGRAKTRPRLTVVERISLAPRQSVALVEVDGQKLLIAIGQEGSPTLCLLESSMGHSRRKLRSAGIPVEGTVG